MLYYANSKDGFRCGGSDSTWEIPSWGGGVGRGNWDFGSEQDSDNQLQFIWAENVPGFVCFFQSLPTLRAKTEVLL